MTDVGTLYLLRHGQSIVNVEERLTCRNPEGDLTALGREQAAKAATWLLDKEIATIRYSPFHRAEQTAAIIGETLGITPVPDDDLREMDCGTLEGRTDEIAWAVWLDVFERWLAHDETAAFSGGESFGEGLSRFQRALGQAKNGENTLLVTHGGITRTVVPYLCVNAAALQRVDWIENTGIVVLEPHNQNRYICWSWNLVEHLEDD